MMYATLLLSSLLLSPASVDTVRVGDPGLRDVVLPVGIDTVDIYRLVDGDKRLVATYAQSVTRIAEGYLVVQENLDASGARLTLDSIALASGTLATLWHGDVTPLGGRHVSFANGGMRGILADSLGETAIDEEIPAGHFDYSVLNLVSDQLPLAPGYQAVLATWDITRGAAYAAVAVTSEESIVLGGESVESWRTEVGVGEVGVTRWVDRNTRRELRWSLNRSGTEMIGESRPRRPGTPTAGPPAITTPPPEAAACTSPASRSSPTGWM